MRKVGRKELILVYVTLLTLLICFLAVFYAGTLSSHVNLGKVFEDSKRDTITCKPSIINSEARGSLLYVWATNVKRVKDNIDTRTFITIVLLYGGNVAGKIENMCVESNHQALPETSNSGKSIERVYKKYYCISETLNESKENVDLYNTEYFLSKKNSDKILTFSEENSPFDFDSFFKEVLFRENAYGIHFLFYKPIIFFSAKKYNFVHENTFAKVNMLPYGSKINNIKKSLYAISAKVFLILLIFGAFAAIWNTRNIVKRIREIEKVVIRIATEKHKDRLSEPKFNIKVNRRDEIGNLAEAINLLREEISRTCREDALQLDGKVVQRAFLPFPNSSSASFFRHKQSFLEISGYYEGASSISGDYFDYKKIDSHRYAFIKCDVSGHGAAAGLIVSVIATLFRSYFSSWKFEANGTCVNDLVIKINDFLYSLNLPSLFAAFVILLYDYENGELFASNAGDSCLHLFRSATSVLEKITLTSSPAAGPIPSEAALQKGCFIVEKFHMERGDILFLYTDGIEESRRYFFAEDFVEEDGAKDFISLQKESFTDERMHAVIESVMQGMCFSLKRQGERDVHFDFSSCEPSPCEAIKAIVAVEQVFRLNPPAESAFRSGLRMNREIDEFLQKHFLDYASFFASPKEENGETYFFPLLREEEQQDDFAIFAIRRV